MHMHQITIIKLPKHVHQTPLTHKNSQRRYAI
jgi:hypothetical protein